MIVNVSHIMWNVYSININGWVVINSEQRPGNYKSIWSKLHANYFIATSTWFSFWCSKHSNHSKNTKTINSKKITFKKSMTHRKPSEKSKWCFLCSVTFFLYTVWFFAQAQNESPNYHVSISMWTTFHHIHMDFQKIERERNDRKEFHIVSVTAITVMT